MKLNIKTNGLLHTLIIIPFLKFKSYIFNFILVTMLSFFLYTFMFEFILTTVVKIFISVVIVVFVFDKFKFSNYFGIRWLKKLVFYTIYSILSIFTLTYFDVSLFNNIFSDSDDEDEGELENINENNIQNNNKEKEIMNNDTTQNEDNNEQYIFKVVHSPYSNLINSVLESSEIRTPLEDILNNLYTLNILEFLLILMLILLLSNKYIYIFNMKLISNFMNKYMPNLFKKYKQYLEKGQNYNEKWTTFLTVFIIILLLIIKLMNLYFSGELTHNINDFIVVYNYIKKI